MSRRSLEKVYIWVVVDGVRFIYQTRNGGREHGIDIMAGRKHNDLLHSAIFLECDIVG